MYKSFSTLEPRPRLLRIHDELATILILSILSLMAGGCSNQLIYGPYVTIHVSKLEYLVNQSAHDNVGTWLYNGTDDRFHYFERQYYQVPWFSNPQRFFAVPKSDMTIPDEVRPIKDNPRELSGTGHQVFIRWLKYIDNDGRAYDYSVFDFNVRDAEYRPTD